jgi:hypothetical protein
MGALPAQAAAFNQGDTIAARYLGKIFRTVIQNFHATLEDSRFEVLVPRLNAVEPELRGFAYEGAGMGLVALDCTFPWKHRLQAFLAGPGSPYIYPIYVGAGLALARLGKQPERYLARLDPVVGWFVIDGGGFRCSIFSRRQYIEEQAIPLHLSPYARRIFDQGMGRGIWFFTGADVNRVAATVGAFPAARCADIWSGVGFVCAYAGGVDRAAIETLWTAADSYRPQLAQGAAVGAKARQRAGNLVPHTDLACEILCGTSGAQAAQMTDVALQNLPTDGAEPAYEIWRQRLVAQFAGEQSLSVGGVPRFVY